MQKKGTSSQRFIVYLIIKSTKQPTVYIYNYKTMSKYLLNATFKKK